MKNIHYYYYKLKEYIKYNITRLNNFNKYSCKLKSYKLFNINLNNNKKFFNKFFMMKYPKISDFTMNPLKNIRVWKSIKIIL